MEEMKKCPYCGELVKSEAKKCKHCGEWLQEQQDNHASQRNCPFCGEVIDTNSESCPYCKEELKHGKTEAQNTENGNEENYKLKNTLSDNIESNTTVAVEKEKLGFFEYYLYDVFVKHFTDFKGEISRKQYWISTLLYWGFFLTCEFLAISTQLDVLFLLPTLILLGGIVPYIAMDVRRLRDCGISGLWILLFLLTPLMLWAMFSKGKVKAMPVKWQKADSIVGGIVGLLLVIGIISTCSGNARYDEEVIPATIELSEDNPYNLPNIAIEEDGQK
ncbi:DUF805 domain-containing protein [Phocaeicola sp.]|uniref:DUF805 domain-containing protein n=1 Tax=Phocaeicola sp. TaxID=2773926 RepID=UPI003869DC1C